MRIRVIVLVSLVAICGTSWGADEASSAASASKKVKKSAKKSQAALPHSRVYIDPATGEMGAPPAGGTLSSSQAGARSSPTAVTVNRDGSLTAVIPRERMVYAVATIGVDGEVAISEAAAKDVKSLMKPVEKGKK